MGVINLISEQSDLNVYEARLLSMLSSQFGDETPSVWNTPKLEEAFGYSLELAPRFTIDFGSSKTLLRTELMVHWLLLFISGRFSKSIIDRQMQATLFLLSAWEEISGHFGVSCLADIPSCLNTYSPSGGQRGSNTELVALFDDWTKQIKSHSLQELEVSYICSQKVIRHNYKSPSLVVVGSILNSVIKTRERFAPLPARNLIRLDDLYSEESIRFKDREIRTDRYLNLYLFPVWMRSPIRLLILTKIERGELAPSTLVGYVGALKPLVSFLIENHIGPNLKGLTSNLIEENFIAWGNVKNIAGKNWFTNALALLECANKHFPSLWPQLSVDPRATRKIKGSYYKLGLGRIAHNQEGSGRSIDPETLSELFHIVKRIKEPVFTIFYLILQTGMRAGDAHAITFDCLSEDSTDEKFMLLTFWQSKVSKYNQKPLLKSDKSHRLLIELINSQREKTIREHGSKTKYLFPRLESHFESWLTPAWTAHQIKEACLKFGLLNENGEPYKFNWHQLRHCKGTSMAMEGHDVLEIMLELGHSSPDMAMAYVNNRYQIKKRALLSKTQSQYLDIQGMLDEKMPNLLIKKDALIATRVCGGACSMPKQVGQWCSHANACFTCRHFRADTEDEPYFLREKERLLELIEHQNKEVKSYADNGQKRMADIESLRCKQNQDVVKNLEAILTGIRAHKGFKGDKLNWIKVNLDDK